MNESENFAAFVQTVWPRVVFVKTKKRITKENFSELEESIIRDDDTPDLRDIEGGAVIFPLSVTNYPSVLRSMTASQAGWWAMCKCDSGGWEKNDENIRSCLSNLEMDM